MHFMSKYHKEIKKEEKKIDIDKIFNLKKKKDIILPLGSCFLDEFCYHLNDNGFKICSKKKNNQFENKNNREFLISGLEREFARFLFDEEVRVGVSLRNDDTYFKGIEILKDKEVYNSILGY